MATAAKQFTSALREMDAEDGDAEDGAPLPLRLVKMGKDDKGKEIEVDILETIATRPKDAIWAMTMAAMSERAGTHESLAASVDFLGACLPEGDLLWFKMRLWDRHDDFGMAEVQEIVEYLIEEWSANPTSSASGSTSSARSSTPRSTRHSPRKASTSTRSG